MTVEIPTAIKQLLDKIITDQEGGWKLTSNANDPDGGWTYAGATRTTVLAYLQEGFSEQDFLDLIKTRQPDTDALIYRIYYEKYCQPLQLEKLPTILQGPVLSCAINRGVETAVKILQGCLLNITCDGNLGSRTLAAIEAHHDPLSGMDGYVLLQEKFLREWTRSYIRLVVENAKAFQRSLLYQDAGDPEYKKLRPTIFRADSLEGWFNRVEYWR